MLTTLAANRTATPIQGLFEKWLTTYHEVNDGKLGDDDVNILLDRMHSFEAQMLDQPSQCIEDLAIKVIAHTSDNVFELESEELMGEMRSLAGLSKSLHG